jgi:di/tricarboxylate transporter
MHRSNAGTRPWRVALLGAVIGSVFAIVAVLVVDRLVPGRQNDQAWMPAGIAAGIIGGGVIGMLISQIVVGGRASKQATQEALNARDAAQDNRDARSTL